MILQANPLLIELLCDGEQETTSTYGDYLEKVVENGGSIAPIIEKNIHSMTCKSCGKKGNYDVGQLTVNTDREPNPDDVYDIVQMTGYFRCKYCNEAGNWEWPPSLSVEVITSILPFRKSDSFGKNVLFDGTSHQYASDAEEHLLHLLKKNPEDAFIWNRLGNLYNKGNRPDLAVCVFEHSIKIDQAQLESHFSLGDILSQIDALPEAGYHFRQTLLYASSYKKLPAHTLRELLANGLQVLFMLNSHTKGDIEFFPTSAERAQIIKEEEAIPSVAAQDFEITPNVEESFFPIAEMFMGLRAKELPIKQRTYKPSIYIYHKAKQKKKKKRK